MIQNYLKTAFRFMLRQKAYAAINVLGLSFGIAASLLILIYIADEISYDRFHADAESMYRVGFMGRLQGNEFASPVTSPPLAEGMREEIPEVQDAVRFGLWRTMPMQFGETSFTEGAMVVADSNFFAFFSFPLISGDPKTVLLGPDKLVITESAAKRYFGDENPIGQLLLRGSDKIACEVTGVVQDPPHNSHIDFDMVLSGESWDFMDDPQWTSNSLYTYFKLTPGSPISGVEEKLRGMVVSHIGAELEQYIGMTFDEFLKQGNNVGFFVQPMLDIHLKSNLPEEITPNGNIQYLYIFGAIAFFIMAIACINFMNLSTARSSNRAKEVGVRKTVGAFRSLLIGQFLSEALLYSMFSGIIALVILTLAMPAFNLLSGKELDFNIMLDPPVIAGFVLFTMIIGLLAGSYPAFYLTAFKPSEVLKGKLRSGFKRSRLRNMLVVIQFVISIALIAGSVIVYQQLRFLQEKNLGFQKENVVNLLHTMSLGENAQAFKNALSSYPDFVAASYANQLPPKIGWNSVFRKEGTDQDFLLSVYHVDHDHLKAMGYEMAKGRFFSREFPADTAAAILNETAFAQMGFDDVEGNTILSYNTLPPTPLNVIGIMKDFHFESLRNTVRPMVIILASEPNFEMAIRLAEGNTQKQIELLGKIFRDHAPGAPFEFSFIDQNFDSLFRAEQRMSSIVLVFTMLAISIACLGLFGLAAYTAEQRTKEIGIRKALGATTSQVMMLLSREFVLLVFVAFVIAAPVSWYFMQQWLSGFAYKITLSVWVFPLSGMAALLIALATVSYQSLKAAQENPVNALKTE